jgi:integral membrane protein
VTTRELATGAVQRLRRVGAVEGVSFLLLLGIAMPLKYLLDMPLAVKVVGWAHGLLFLLFLAALVQARRHARLSIPLLGVAFVASLVPFGPFLIDRRLASHPLPDDA